MGPKSGWGGVQIGYVRPVQFLDHLTVITRTSSWESSSTTLWGVLLQNWRKLDAAAATENILKCEKIFAGALMDTRQFGLHINSHKDLHLVPEILLINQVKSSLLYKHTHFCSYISRWNANFIWKAFRKPKNILCCAGIKNIKPDILYILYPISVLRPNHRNHIKCSILFVSCLFLCRKSQ